MKNDNDVYIGGVSGFLNKIFELLKSKPTYIGIACDTGSKTWRHDISIDYKSNRAKTPAELVPQFNLLYEMCEVAEITTIKREGFEADDIIASCAKNYASQDIQVHIVSGDKDLLQLVNEKVSVIDPFTRMIFNKENVQKKWGIFPNQIVDMLSLTGDSADNIMGVPNIGIKTAVSWLQKYNTLDSIVKNIENLKPPARKLALQKNLASAYDAKSLVLLDDNVPIPELNLLKCNINYENLRKFCTKHQLWNKELFQNEL